MQALRAVRYQLKHGAKVIKICATAGVLSFDATVGAQQLSDEEMKAVVDEAKRHGVKVAAHAHGSEGILAAVKAGVASIEHGSMLTDEIIALMKTRGTYLVPTAYLLTAINLSALPPPIAAKARQIIPLAQESHRQAVKAGVKIAFGTDAGVYPHGVNAREFAVYVGYGMTPLEAIRAATTGAADLLGVGDRGVIAAGQARGSRRRARRSAQGHQGDGTGVVRDEGRRGCPVVRWSGSPQSAVLRLCGPADLRTHCGPATAQSPAASGSTSCIADGLS